jgi:electron-transferring-flavoprotein dehydrogenase
MGDREELELDVVIVGAGPGGLACAYRLQQLLNQHNEAVAAGTKEGPDLSAAMIAVLEKGGAVGDHSLSGAVMDPRAIAELMPDWREQGCPGVDVTGDELVFLTSSGSIKAPLLPPMLQNHGNRVVSIQRLTKWLAEKVEAQGTQIFTGFPAADTLFDGERVVGVRTGDKGIDKHGAKKANFEPGMDVKAKVTILAEGTRGSLTKQLVSKLKLDAGKNPQVYAAGVKEVWHVPGIDAKRKGHVIHTMGYPLDMKTFGGGFIYFMGDDLVVLGFVTGLDYLDPTTDPHRNLQLYKQHPYVRALIEGGTLRRYGAKTIPEGGWWSRPKPSFDGGLLIGDAGSNLNPARLKGIHMAIKTGMLAAETAFEALVTGDSSEATMFGFDERVHKSWVSEELRGVRNFHQSFEHGAIPAFFHIGLQMISGGRGLKDKYEGVAGHTRMKKIAPGQVAPAPKFDGKLTFDKLTDVFNSGTIHEEDQPCHLVVLVDPNHCSTTCAREYGNPCQHFCPAAVYEMVEAPERNDGAKKLKINASNCVHCKTCDIMDPYQAINWVTPEGGGGPVYTDL